MSRLVTLVTKIVADRVSTSQLPPASDEDVATLRRMLGYLPECYEQLIRETSGINLGDGGTLRFTDFGVATRFAELFPKALVLGKDDCGNEAIIDGTDTQRPLGPVYFICHDPPCVAVLSLDLETFLEEYVLNGTWGSGIDAPSDEIDRALGDIYEKNPYETEIAGMNISADTPYNSWLRTLPPDAYVCDLSVPRVGQGFDWAKFGTESCHYRYGDHTVFAVGPHEDKNDAVDHTYTTCTPSREDSLDAFAQLVFPCVVYFAPPGKKKPTYGYSVARGRVSFNISLPGERDRGGIVDSVGNHFILRPEADAKKRPTSDLMWLFNALISKPSVGLSQPTKLTLDDAKSEVFKIVYGVDRDGPALSGLQRETSEKLLEAGNHREIVEFVDWYQSTDGGRVA